MSVLRVSNKRGVLRVSSANARYVTDDSGKAIYLSGFHTWATVQDGGPTNPPPVFDWDEYLNACVTYGCNFVKLWSCETPRGWSDITDIWFYPPYYERTGPGTAADGGLKFDLTKINQTWLQRLHDRAVDCWQRGIWACVQLFDGWNIEAKGLGGSPFTYHWYNSTNNINSINGDQNSDGQGTETHYNNGSNVVITYQEALVEAVIDKLNSMDNIFYEVSNEDTEESANTSWQYRIINKINTYQAGKPKQHLVMMTKQWPNVSDSSADINSNGSNAQLVSYSTTNADAVATGSKVSMYDTDHTVGLTSGYTWIWTSLCNGHGGAWYMDEWDGASYLGIDRRNDANYILIRQNLGYALTLTRLLKDMLGMTPQAALSSSGYCLAKNHATAAEYVCYYSGSSTFNLNLSTATGTLNLRWLRCSDGTISTGTVSGGATRTLTPPWTGVVVVYVYH